MGALLQPPFGLFNLSTLTFNLDIADLTAHTAVIMEYGILVHATENATENLPSLRTPD